MNASEGFQEWLRQEVRADSNGNPVCRATDLNARQIDQAWVVLLSMLEAYKNDYLSVRSECEPIKLRLEPYPPHNCKLD